MIENNCILPEVFTPAKMVVYLYNCSIQQCLGRPGHKTDKHYMRLAISRKRIEDTVAYFANKLQNTVYRGAVKNDAYYESCKDPITGKYDNYTYYQLSLFVEMSDSTGVRNMAEKRILTGQFFSVMNEIKKAEMEKLAQQFNSSHEEIHNVYEDGVVSSHNIVSNVQFNRMLSS